MNLNDFDFPGILTRVVAAVIILLVTALVARLVKSVLSKQLVKISPLHKQGDSGQSLGESLASVVSLIVWLFGLMAVLNLFNLTSVLSPIQDLLAGLLGALPGIIGAALIFFVGFIVARIVRDIVTTSLQAAGADHWLERGAQRAEASPTETTPDGGASSAVSSVSISDVVGKLVFALILVVISISALQVLGIEAIAAPATQMLNLILTTIPAILSAAVLLGLGYLIGSFVAPLLESVLSGLGVDRSLADLGVSTTSTKPSAVIGRVAHVAIVLFFAIAATRVLGFSEITAILDAVLEIGGQVLFGAAVIAVGVFVANVLARLASGQAAPIVRWATIGLFAAMGLQFMGLADTIVTLAFGSVVVGAAAAAALAFGLGGRDVAARQLERLQAQQSQGSLQTGTSTGTGTTGTSTPGSSPTAGH